MKFKVNVFYEGCYDFEDIEANSQEEASGIAMLQFDKLDDRIIAAGVLQAEVTEITPMDQEELDKSDDESVDAPRKEKSARTLLREKILSNYAEYKTQWLHMQPEELIAHCEELEAVTRMAQELPMAISEENAKYLLRFKNPLEVVSDEWINRNGIDSLIINDEMSDILWTLKDNRNPEDFYDMEPDFCENFEDQTLTM